MAGTRNSKYIATIDNDLDFRANSFDGDALSPLPGATNSLFAPSSVNDGISGCVSEISSAAIHSRAHDYNTAMKSYADVYEKYQSYLMPTEQLAHHDYDMAAKPVPDFSHLGCLNADLLDSTLLNDDISDDDIENCGYTAWVHH